MTEFLLCNELCARERLWGASQLAIRSGKTNVKVRNDFNIAFHVFV